MSKPAAVTTKPAAKPVRSIRPVKAKALTTAVEAAAAYAAYHHDHKATPAKADWNKIVQQIGLSLGYLRVPYAFGLTLLPVWTSAYKAAQKGHVPAKPVVIPPKAVKKSVNKSSSKSVSKNEPDAKTAVQAAIVALTALFEAL